MNIGIMTSGQPWRINERVPSKSKSTWLTLGRGANPGANSTDPVNETFEDIARE